MASNKVDFFTDFKFEHWGRRHVWSGWYQGKKYVGVCEAPADFDCEDMLMLQAQRTYKTLKEGTFSGK